MVPSLKEKMKKDNIKKVVYSAVVADLFHYGHLQSLKFAKSKGDYLICGILTDEAAKYYKKILISNFKERKEIISNLNFVDDVMAQYDKDPTDNLRKIHQRFKDSQIILVHGDDWKTIPGTKFLEKIGGKVVTHPYYPNLSDFKIMKNFLERYRGKFKDFDEFTKYFELENFTYFNPRKIKDTLFSSKADTLRYLKPLLKKSRIENIFVFTVLDWKEEKEGIISQIKKNFSPSFIVVRSSTISEDASESSMAGYFYSELDVPSDDTKCIESAINKVIQSYNEKKSDFMINQILIQPQTRNVAMSGVVFTRAIEKNSPYYIINYDDQTGSTETVTRGLENKAIKISKFSNQDEYPKKFKNLMISIKEIESIISGISLDIEFAINRKGEVVIFQVRPLVINSKQNNTSDKKIKKRIDELKQQFKELSEKKKHLAGNSNCFGDMPDWNPAEIIGDNCNYLDYSLYDYIITDSAWHQARTSQGYTNVNPAKLVVMFGNKPYVNVRNTFNSFIPASIRGKLKEKLIDFYINKLRKNPELQDKVEFEILYTCYDLSFDKKSKELSDAGFTPGEISGLKQSLLALTNNLLKTSKKSIDEDMNSVFSMKKVREESKKAKNPKSSSQDLLKHAKRLLDDCRSKGTVQFSRLARLAFIGNIILKSMVNDGLINKNFYESFLNSISTIAKKMNSDFNLLIQDKMSQNDFLKLYGHLRPGTYDITNPRYDKNPNLLKGTYSLAILSENESKFKIKDSDYAEITEALKLNNIDLGAGALLDFIKSAIESRELSKFEFTKSLSDAIELIAEAGASFGFSRNEMAQLDVKSLFQYMGEKDGIIKKEWEKIIHNRKKERKLNGQLILPPILYSEKDFDIISYYSVRPNFITQKKVEAELINISHISDNNFPELNQKIVLLENGDPGYDWVYTKNPAGLITKYGGAASHMAIRAAEFGLPAAIGCGEIFDSLKLCRSVILDCSSKKIMPLR